jgi:hypothetical protein
MAELDRPAVNLQEVVAEVAAAFARYMSA